MRVTASMIVRARRAFDHHNRLIGVGQLIPTSDDAIRAMLEAALADIPEIPAVLPVADDAGKARALGMAPRRPAILVTSAKPRPAALLETEYPPTIEVGQIWFAKAEPSREILDLAGTLVRYRSGADTIHRIRAENFRLWIETWRASLKRGEQ